MIRVYSMLTHDSSTHKYIIALTSDLVRISTWAPKPDYQKHQPAAADSLGMSRPASRRRLKYVAKNVRSVFGQTRSKNSGEKSGCISNNVLTAARASSNLPCPDNAAAKFA